MVTLWVCFVLLFRTCSYFCSRSTSYLGLYSTDWSKQGSSASQTSNKFSAQASRVFTHIGLCSVTRRSITREFGWHLNAGNVPPNWTACDSTHLKEDIVGVDGDGTGVKHEALSQQAEQVVGTHGILLASAHNASLSSDFPSLTS